MKIKGIVLFAACAGLLSACCAKPEKGENLAKRPISEWHAVLKEGGDPSEVFTQDKGVIRARGDYGYIRTNDAFSEYELSVEWRWIGEATNSGIFVNLYEDGIWPSGYEIQLMAGNAGDVINSGSATSYEMAVNLADSTILKPRVIAKMNPSNEKPVGEWNQAVIRCEEGTIMVHINGELQNNLTGLSSSAGFVGLQSEGQGIEFRNVILTPLCPETCCDHE